MKKFRFSLDKVLVYRVQKESNLKNRHAEAVKAVNLCKEEIETLENKKNRYIDQQRMHNSNIIFSGEQMIYENWFKCIDETIRIEKQHLDELKKAEQEILQQVIEAKVNRKSIELLKEKKVKEYRREVQRENEILIEEFISNKKIADEGR